MKLRKDKKIEEIKMNLWIDVYKSVTGLWNAGKDTDFKYYADKAVKDFEETFEK